ncbi:MAG: chloride channel protein [Deltaproteobacteria bacterium]|nr:chloride channel protein [Deltaproteobacteria bacterium]
MVDLSPARDLELGRLRRTLWHAAIVGITAGLVGAAFFAAVELVQRSLLEGWAGYEPLRAAGERFGPEDPSGSYRPWLLVFLPMLGGLVAGLLAKLAPEILGGGTDAFVEAVHARGAVIRRRVAPLKAIASIATLGTGGAGGREGPIMLIGGAIGSWLSSALRLTPRERRLLVVAGAAAGMSAVFRTPLGAALLAVEVLYQDGFESEALIPSILASVMSYSVVISIFGESTMFAHAARYPFVPAHLPLYALLAIVAAAFAVVFVTSIHHTKRFFDGLPGPAWIKPGLGGLALGVLCVPIISTIGARAGSPGQGLGLLGGGYGAVQVAISGGPLLGNGVAGVELLLLLCIGKVVASSLTIGSGGSAGDFAPSLVLGGLLGGAFGRAAALIFEDPRIDPSAFVLVGMGAFYGGIAHVPLSALVLVCELAGSYDLLVPLMLAEAIAFVLLRRRTLYTAQLPAAGFAPPGPTQSLPQGLAAMSVGECLRGEDPVRVLRPDSRASEMLDALRVGGQHNVFPVVRADGQLIGIVSPSSLAALVEEREASGWVLAHDLMQRPVSIRREATLPDAATLMLSNELEALPVVDDHGAILGVLHQSDLTSAYLRAAWRSDRGESGIRGARSE